MKELVGIIQDILYFGLEKFGRYYSSYRGFVVNRNDPEDYNRVQLCIPNITGVNSFPYWAWPKNNYSGKGYGSQIVPSKGEMVWVEFEFGDPRKPIYSFGHFGKGDKPDQFKSNPDNYWFMTPGGQSIELDDKNKVFRVTGLDGKTFEFNGNGISLIRGDKAISLGKLDGSDEPAVLGDQNADALNAIIDKVNILNNNLIKYATAQATAVSSVTVLSPLGAALSTLLEESIQLTIEIEQLDLTVEKTKSVNVTLD